MQAKQLNALFFLMLLFLFVGVSLAMVLPFVTAIFWGATLAILTYPWYRKIRDRYRKVLEGNPTGLKRKVAEVGDSLAAVRTTILTLLVICLPILLIGSIAFAQVGNFVADADGTGGYEVTQKIDKMIDPIAKKVGMDHFSLKEWWEMNGQEITKNLRTPAANLAKQIGTGLFTMVVSLLSMFFLQRDGHLLIRPFQVLSGLPEARADRILEKAGQTIQAVFRGTVTVAIIQGTIMGVTYALLGVQNSVLLGFFSIILSIIPLLGAPVIYIPVGLVFLIQGDYVKAGVVLGVGFLLVSQIDNILKPFFIGNQVSLHPLAIFFFALGGIALFGPIGLMVGPVILSVLLLIYDYIVELKGLAGEEGLLSEVGSNTPPGDSVA